MTWQRLRMQTDLRGLVIQTSAGPIPPVRLNRIAMLATVSLIVALLATCGQSRPSSSDYVGKWEGTVESLTGSDGHCYLDISPLSQSLVIKSVRQRVGNCAAYEGVWTLTPEGNLKGGPLGNILIAYDKKSGRAAVSGFGRLRYLRRLTEEELQVAFFEGKWMLGQRIPAHFDVFEVKNEITGQLQFRRGLGQPNGDTAWLDSWPAEVQNGSLHVTLAKGNATLTPRNEDELTYKDGDATVVCARMGN